MIHFLYALWILLAIEWPSGNFFFCHFFQPFTRQSSGDLIVQDNINTVKCILFLDMYYVDV